MAITTGATIDKFVVWISATDPRYDVARVRAFVGQLGADEVHFVGEQGGRDV